MKDWIKIGITLLICILAFTAYQELFPTYKIKTETKLVKDTTTIDSLKSRVIYWENIADSLQKTVTDTVVIEKPVQVNDSTRKYTSNYSDSTLSAEWETKVVGVIKNQKFSYTLKRQKVVRDTIEITTTQTKVYEKTITKIREPNPYFSIGAELGQHSFGPIVSYTTSKQYNIFYRYDINTNSHNVGVMIPIKLNLNPFK